LPLLREGEREGPSPDFDSPVSLGVGQVRQIPVPDSLCAFAQTQKLLMQIAGINLELLKERKRKRQ